MSCLLRLLRVSCGALLGLTAVLGAGACAGTPLPEPPDGLPRPEFLDGFTPGTAMWPPREQAEVSFSVRDSAAQVGARMWAVNLDAPDVPPQEVSANSMGIVNVTITVAAGDRVRLVSRTDRAHSPPLDLVAVAPDAVSPPVSIVPLFEDTRLDCLRITPSDSLTLAGTRGQLTLENQCGVPIGVTRAALRLGDQGIRLAAPPAEIAVGAQVRLTLEDSQGPGVRERLDILLLDVTAADGPSERYAIDVFSELE
jgi:hypothetical protein